MTSNQVKALDLQEQKRHNKVNEIIDAVSIVPNTIGSVGSLLKGFGSYRKAGNYSKSWSSSGSKGGRK